MNAPAKVNRIATMSVTGFIGDAMIKSGVPPIDAGKIAELMLEADLTGADAHGVFLLPQYIQRLKFGSTNANLNITVNRTAPATALVDGETAWAIWWWRARRRPQSNWRRKTVLPGLAAACPVMPVPPAFTRRCR